MKKCYALLLTFSVSFVSFSQFKNVKLAEQAGESLAVNPSIAINKKNPDNIVAAALPNQLIISNDGGKTWSNQKLKTKFESNANPSVVSNFKGHFYYLYLTAEKKEGVANQIICKTSEDDGASWSDGIFVDNNSSFHLERQWPSIHPKKNEVLVTWTQFDKYKSSDAGCHSTIFFSKSMNGTKFSKPVEVNEIAGDCQDDDNTASGAMTAIGVDGKIYVTWANQGEIFLDRSYDNGSTWLSNDLVVIKQEGGWSHKISGIAHGAHLPVLTIDNSVGRYQGTLYLLYADQKNGSEDTDLWLIKSRSRGDLWSKPLRINKDEVGGQQFLPWMAVDQTNGNIYIVYYDRRDHDETETEVYLAYSFDGGTSFSEIKISESFFTPNASTFLTSYIGIDAHGGVITPVWTRTDDGKTSVWTSIIRESDLPKPVKK